MKRARRQGDGPDEGGAVDEEAPRTGPRLSQDDALAALAALHERFADEQIDFDEFETKKAEWVKDLPRLATFDWPVTTR